MPNLPARRSFLVWLGLAASLPGTALMAQGADEIDPTDLVPRRFSPEAFARLSDAELYKVDLAIRRGRRILIDGHSPSQSRLIIETARHDRAAALRMLQ